MEIIHHLVTQEIGLKIDHFAYFWLLVTQCRINHLLLYFEKMLTNLDFRIEENAINMHKGILDILSYLMETLVNEPWMNQLHWRISFMISPKSIMTRKLTYKQEGEFIEIMKNISFSKWKNKKIMKNDILKRDDIEKWKWIESSFSFCLIHIQSLYVFVSLTKEAFNWIVLNIHVDCTHY